MTPDCPGAAQDHNPTHASPSAQVSSSTIPVGADATPQPPLAPVAMAAEELLPERWANQSHLLKPENAHLKTKWAPRRS